MYRNQPLIPYARNLSITHPLLYSKHQIDTSMQPDDQRPTTPIVVPPRESGLQIDARQNQTAPQQAAANIARDQINSIYTKTAAQEQPAITTQPEAPSPYERTHEAKRDIQPNTWQRYHSAWQNYYQQYYERYYMGEVDRTKRSLEAKAAVQHREPEVFTEDEALYDLRSKLLGRVQERAQKVRKSRHFVPIAAALGVMLVFLFLQYNRVFFSYLSAYVTPSNVNPENLIIDPKNATTVTKDDRVIVPKVNIDVPLVWDAIASDQNSLNRAMDKGAVWFNVQGASSKPGEKGNSVFSAHSSNDWTDQGDYKFAFAPLEKLGKDDTIYINYQQKRYIYTITHTKVVKPTDVAALQIGEDKPRITLITCVPLGTALNRLLVFADQVSPDPSAAAAAPVAAAPNAAPKDMPRNSPTFFERIFGTS